MPCQTDKASIQQVLLTSSRPTSVSLPALAGLHGGRPLRKKANRYRVGFQLAACLPARGRWTHWQTSRQWNPYTLATRHLGCDRGVGPIKCFRRTRPSPDLWTDQTGLFSPHNRLGTSVREAQYLRLKKSLIYGPFQLKPLPSSSDKGEAGTRSAFWYFDHGERGTRYE